jgi:hypothetical protein
MMIRMAVPLLFTRVPVSTLSSKATPERGYGISVRRGYFSR